MTKSAHTPEFRAMVSQEYLDGLVSYNSLATNYQILKYCVRKPFCPEKEVLMTL